MSGHSETEWTAKEQAQRKRDFDRLEKFAKRQKSLGVTEDNCFIDCLGGAFRADHLLAYEIEETVAKVYHR